MIMGICLLHLTAAGNFQTFGNGGTDRMPKKSQCPLFWCTEVSCENYHSGCMHAHYRCDKDSRCEYCVLQNVIAMKSDGDEGELTCAEIFDAITSIWRGYECD